MELVFQRIGGRRFINTDVRVLAASNQDLLNMSIENEHVIRQDLFHRLSVFTVTLPPLCERGGDIEILAEELFLNACSEFKKNIKGIEPSALDALVEYPWPGNIREMKNVIQRAVLICRGDLIKLEHLPSRVRTSEKGVEDIKIPTGASLKEAEKLIIT